MILTASKLTKIANANPHRCYIAIENVNAEVAKFVYISQQDARDEGEQLINTGFKLGAMGILEIQNCESLKAKKAWYAYTTDANIDIRVLEV